MWFGRGRLRVLVNGSCLVAQRTANHEPPTEFRIVPTADFRLSKLVAHKQPLHCC